MCFLVECKTCNKTSWKGCGNHLVDLYKRVENGKHCTCRPWPGVVVPPPPTENPKPSVAQGKTVVKEVEGNME